MRKPLPKARRLWSVRPLTTAPMRLELLAARHAAPELLERLVGHVEVLVRRPAVALLGQPDLLLAQRGAVGAGGVLLVRRAVGDVRADDDEARMVLDRLRLLQ